MLYFIPLLLIAICLFYRIKFLESFWDDGSGVAAVIILIVSATFIFCLDLSGWKEGNPAELVQAIRKNRKGIPYGLGFNLLVLLYYFYLKYFKDRKDKKFLKELNKIKKDILDYRHLPIHLQDKEALKLLTKTLEALEKQYANRSLLKAIDKAKELEQNYSYIDIRSNLDELEALQSLRQLYDK